MGGVLSHSLKAKRQHADFSARSDGSNSSSGNRRYESASFQNSRGRRYHNDKDVPYFLPNDDIEFDRLDAQHYMLHELIKSNHLCRLENPHNMLDVGAGTGTWAMEMAAEFPDTHVVGIDISPIQPSTVRPPNVEFDTMNVLEGIRYENNSFAYVHLRLLCGAVPKPYWPTLIWDMARVCVPGGVVEVCETDGAFRNAGPIAAKFNRWISTVCASANIYPDEVWNVPRMMEEAGLQVAQEQYYELPIGSWHGRLGELGFRNLIGAVSGFRHKIVELCDETEANIDATFEQLHEEINAYQCYWRIGVFVGRK
ncbi:S-adenosyl-L-methionine-dependent methyltransferase [Syncephalis pseudoplumigaleata]|uniref:S-adenosyl-L-methionine-dependent methyltransferase n=1 Tax=Syncephalis pseudoplumigaleata TaxID=1712513 RepID=A0A4P9Z2L0_9FUNG|nr:S-adenosyl-L-methionine-dependent methyltransferase [Syncephalis pseudoplumigaleata]|eukprot:RKP26021.1 S-adenosyl-L-methionine-dependent methyltransferase [Syncephalis pseudoplumigaleata]